MYKFLKVFLFELIIYTIFCSNTSLIFAGSEGYKYKFQPLEKHYDMNFGSVVGINSNGYVYGYTSVMSNQIPTIWDSSGKVIRRLDKNCNSGIFTDMNDKNELIGLCLPTYSKYYSFMYSLNTGSYTVLMNSPNRLFQATELNNNSEVLGFSTDLNHQDMQVMFLKKSNSNVISINLSTLLKSQVPSGTQITLGDYLYQDGSVILNANNNDGSRQFVGYFEKNIDGKNEWKLKQGWDNNGIFENSLYFSNATDDYLELISIQNDCNLIVNSYIYQRVSRDKETKFNLLYNMKEYLISKGYNTDYVDCNSINKYGVSLCMFEDKKINDIVYFKFDIKNGYYENISELMKNDLVEMPENYLFYPSNIGDDNYIYGQYRDIYMGIIFPGRLTN